jgi:POT family proton-dependent oligopeptide transporter
VTATATATGSEINDRAFFGHPPGLAVCFATEMWERFSFYGMKYLLLLYLTKYHLFTDSEGLEVLGGYAALVYAMPVIGGLLADRYLGMRKSVILGGLLLVAGHLGMAVEGEQARLVGGAIERDDGALQVFYASLALIVIGVGFLKPNISTIVGRLYGKDDPRRDSGFTIFYMGINLGSFSATLLCGYLGETLGWAYGFGAAGIGMLFGLATFIYGQKYLLGLAEPPKDGQLKKRTVIGLNREWSIYLSALLAVAVVWQMLQFHAAVGLLLNSSVPTGAGRACLVYHHALQSC